MSQARREFIQLLLTLTPLDVGWGTLSSLPLGWPRLRLRDGVNAAEAVGRVRRVTGAPAF
jgi:hypothetical protein